MLRYSLCGRATQQKSIHQFSMIGTDQSNPTCKIMAEVGEIHVIDRYAVRVDQFLDFNTNERIFLHQQLQKKHSSAATICRVFVLVHQQGKS
jgi:hypothetical protein